MLRALGDDKNESRGELPAVGRVGYIEAWAVARGIGSPSKVRVAAGVVGLRGDRRLTSGTRRKAVQTLYGPLRRRESW